MLFSKWLTWTHVKEDLLLSFAFFRNFGDYQFTYYQLYNSFIIIRVMKDTQVILGVI